MAQLKQKHPDFEYASIETFENLLRDKPEHERWELLGGRVTRAMVGARIEHQRIIRNIDYALGQHFSEKNIPCESLRETFWLKERKLELQAFPDLMVHCGEIKPGSVSVSDPLILFEITSKTSDDRDRFGKGDLYRQLPSLQQYVLIQRDEASIEVYNRTDAGRWSASGPLSGLDSILPLPSIGLDLPLADIYRGVFMA